MGDECQHGKQHEHHHHHHVGLAEGMAPAYAQKLQWVLGLSVFYLLAQVIGGYLSGSLALLAEAGHKLADVGAIALALFATWFASLSTSPQKTFGYFRVEILAALINGLALAVIAVSILFEAWARLQHGHHHIEGQTMLLVASMGLLINLLAAWILFPARGENLNVKGALYHIVADILGSGGTILTAAGILIFKAMWLDTLISAVIACMVLYNAGRILREAVHILLEAAPDRLSVDAVRQFIHDREGVTDVHDLHIWTITTGKEALLAHVRVTREAFSYHTAQTLEKELRDTFDLCHITVQLEPPGFEEDEILF